MKNNKKGFTLVELIVVIVLLVTISTMAYNVIVPKINEKKPQTFVNEISEIIKAFDRYSAEGGVLHSEDFVMTSCGYKHCSYLTIEELTKLGKLRYTGNEKANGTILLCDGGFAYGTGKKEYCEEKKFYEHLYTTEYYISYTNGLYKTKQFANIRSILVSEDGSMNNMVQCSDDGLERCSYIIPKSAGGGTSYYYFNE